jgi:hypothetical protein
MEQKGKDPMKEKSCWIETENGLPLCDYIKALSRDYVCEHLSSTSALREVRRLLKKYGLRCWVNSGHCPNGQHYVDKD